MIQKILRVEIQKMVQVVVRLKFVSMISRNFAQPFVESLIHTFKVSSCSELDSCKFCFFERMNNIEGNWNWTWINLN